MDTPIEAAVKRLRADLEFQSHLLKRAMNSTNPDESYIRQIKNSISKVRAQLFRLTDDVE